jgi:hypothetical protein
MKKLTLIASVSLVFACNNANRETTEPKPDTSAASSADSILKAVEKMKADSAAMHGDSTSPKHDTPKK